MSNVFIIHGRDTRAVAELQSFIRDLGLSVLTVEDLGANRRGLASISEIISEGINTASIVLALLTPDESVALFDPTSNQLAQSEAGWQARPNVIFELGIAFSKSPDRTIIASIGNHRPFTDISGLSYLRLDDSDAKQQLAVKMSTLLGGNLKKDPKSVTGDFRHLSRERWSYFDELVELENRMKNKACGKAKIQLWDIVTRVILANPDENWSGSGRFDETSAERFMNAICQEFPRARSVISESFWWLVVLGFFEYGNINQWWQKEQWRSSCQYAFLSRRGHQLISKVRLLSQDRKAAKKTVGA